MTARPDPYPVAVLARPIDAVVTVPGSKSLTNRALVCAALAEGTSTIDGALVADDSEAMAAGLRELGAGVGALVASSLEVAGMAGLVGRPGSVGADVDVDARLSGTTARFLAPLLALGDRPHRLDGQGAMRERPMGPTIVALRALGAEVIEVGEPGHLPLVIGPGVGGLASHVSVPGEASSQFASGLLLAAPCRPEGLRLTLDGDVVSAPYLAMTVTVMEAFGAEVDRPDERTFVVRSTGYRATGYRVEPDASSASYFFAAAAIVGGRVRVEGLGARSRQGDLGLLDVLARMGAEVTIGDDHIEVTGTGRLTGIDVDLSDLPDMAQTLAAVAVFADGPTTVRGVGFIRGHETDRIAAIVTELGRCGIEATETDDGFVVHPGPPRPAVVQTYADHRMAMSFALLGLRAPGLEVADPGCVAKTFPGFWDALAGLSGSGRPAIRVRGAMAAGDQTPPMRLIAIDGPAGSGKSTVAKAVAARLGLQYLDTGAMYRAVTFAAMRRGVDPADVEPVARVARDLELRMEADGSVLVDGADATIEIRGPEVTRAVSIVAANPGVRDEMRRRQREWAEKRGGGVMEGRDIGTVVFPDAELKVYLDASPDVRANRRSKEVAELDYETVATDLARRDALDQGREHAPLREADDAVVIDTSDLSVDQIVDAVLDRLGGSDG